MTQLGFSPELGGLWQSSAEQPAQLGTDGAARVAGEVEALPAAGARAGTAVTWRHTRSAQDSHHRDPAGTSSRLHGSQHLSSRDPGPRGRGGKVFASTQRALSPWAPAGPGLLGSCWAARSSPTALAAGGTVQQPGPRWPHCQGRTARAVSIQESERIWWPQSGAERSQWQRGAGAGTGPSGLRWAVGVSQARARLAVLRGEVDEVIQGARAEGAGHGRTIVSPSFFLVRGRHRRKKKEGKSVVSG